MAMGIPRKFKTDKFKRETPAPLKFGADGKFKILHITDIHCVEPEMDDDEKRAIPEHRNLETINVIEKLVEKTNPDLVVFGGDNVSGYWEEFTYSLMQNTIQRITEPIRKRNIPLCVVFGNHDGEVGFHTEFQMMQYMEYPNCRSNLNDADVYGCGNCCVTIKDSKGEKDAFAIWLMDSNDYERNSTGDFSYDHVHDDQIEWYEKTAQRIKDEHGGRTIPAILFQHIPVIEEYELLREAKPHEKIFEAVEGHRIFSDKKYMLKDGVDKKIEDYVYNGGKFISTFLTGIVDKDDLCHLGGFPCGNLKEVFGIKSYASRFVSHVILNVVNTEICECSTLLSCFCSNK